MFCSFNVLSIENKIYNHINVVYIHAEGNETNFAVAAATAAAKINNHSQPTRALTRSWIKTVPDLTRINLLRLVSSYTFQFKVRYHTQ